MPELRGPGRAAPLLALALAGCAQGAALSAFDGTRPELRPELFFLGETRGEGVLDTSFGSPKRFQVTSTGRAIPGGIAVEQVIRWSDDKVDRRRWTLRAVAPGRYRGVLSDAAGPVSAEVRGHALRLRYLLRRPGVTMEQHLYLQPDGRSLRNEGTVRALGIVVARLSERIGRAAP